MNRLGTSMANVTAAKSAERDWEALDSAARDVLFQLFVFGPVYDGYITSKTGRDRLVDCELAERGHGFQWLSRRGLQVALCADWSTWSDNRAHNKATSA